MEPVSLLFYLKKKERKKNHNCDILQRLVVLTRRKNYFTVRTTVSGISINKTSRIKFMESQSSLCFSCNKFWDRSTFKMNVGLILLGSSFNKLYIISTIWLTINELFFVIDELINLEKCL